MPSRQLGPWRLVLKDSVGAPFTRFIAADGERLAWVWLWSGQDAGDFAPWSGLPPPWLTAQEIRGPDGRLAIATEYAGGVPFAELLDALPEDQGLTLPASAAIALTVAEALGRLPKTIDPHEVPRIVPESILLGFDGAVRFSPWPSVFGHVVPPAIDVTAANTKPFHPDPGWQVHSPALLLLHALDGLSPFAPDRRTHRALIPGDLARPETIDRLPEPLAQVVASALARDLRKRPRVQALIDALTPLASTRELEDALARQVPHEPKEQQFDRALALGRDPEPLPPDLVASVANEASDDAFKVLADWLLGEGLPRGELAAIQLKLEQGASVELARAEAVLLRNHRSLLPVTLRERLSLWRPLWRAGWLVGLELKAVPEAEPLTEILTHPALRFLQRIRVRPEGGGSKVLAEVLASLELPALRQVELDGGVATFGPQLRRARPHLTVESNRRTPAFPTRRRPEASIPHAKVGVGDREPAPGLPPLNRLMDWLSGDD